MNIACDPLSHRLVHWVPRSYVEISDESDDSDTTVDLNFGKKQKK